MKPGYTTAVAIALTILAFTVSAQQQGGFNPVEFARRALAEPLFGITSDGAPQLGLYEIKKTGVSTALVLDAARRTRPILPGRAASMRTQSFTTESIARSS